MKVFIVVLLIVVIGIFIWQAILFVRDLIRMIKKKKAKKNTDDANRSSDNASDRKE